MAVPIQVKVLENLRHVENIPPTVELQTCTNRTGTDRQRELPKTEMRDQGCQTEENFTKENFLQSPSVSASVAEDQECVEEESESQSPVRSTHTPPFEAKAQEGVRGHKEESTEEREQEWMKSAVSNNPLRLRFDPSIPPKGKFLLLDASQDKEQNSKQKSQESTQKCSDEAAALSYHTCCHTMPASLLDLISEVPMLVYPYTV